MPRPPQETDVVIAAAPEDRALAAKMATWLRASRFFVSDASLGAPGPAMDEASDVVVILSPAALVRLAQARDELRAVVAEAFVRRKVVVPVCLPGVDLSVASLPSDVSRIVGLPLLVYDPLREAESLSRLAHSLSSDAEVEERTLMRRATLAAWTVGLIAVGVVAYFVVPPLYRAATAPAPKPALAPFTLSWGGLVQREVAGVARTISVAEDGALRAGDRLRLVVAASSAGHVYVVMRTSAGVDVLFPPHALRGASRVEAGRTYVVPDGTVPVDVGDGAPGSGVFVIGSYDPLENLEELADEPDPSTSPAERLDLLASTLNGLLDGRHASAPRNLRTRAGNLIDPKLAMPAMPATADLLSADGRGTAVVLSLRRGALSAAIELRVTPR